MTRDLAVVLVSWNVRALILDALRTLNDDLERSGLGHEVWVVDNASVDGSAEAIRSAFPAASLIASPKNLGFAAGNNLALRAIGFQDRPSPNPDGPRAVFLLNPDTLTQPGAIKMLYDSLFSLPKAGLVGARLSYEDGAFQHSAFRFPDLWQILFDLYPMPDRIRGRFYESRLNGRYPRAQYSPDAPPFPVDHTLGATMMIRREAIEQTGIFDERYFMYVEEIDWSMRIRRAGWEIYAVPGAQITHLEGRSTRQIRPESLLNLWTSRYRFFDLYYRPATRAFARLLVRGGMRWQIAKTRRAVAQGRIDQAKADALIAAYRKIMTL